MSGRKAPRASYRIGQGRARHKPQWNSAMPSSPIVDIAAEVKGETDLAWRLYDGNVTAWVPKSQAEDNHDGTFAMPEWLAVEKEFL